MNPQKNLIQELVDEVWLKHFVKIVDKELSKYFGKNYLSLELERCCEEKFKSWWISNKEIPYNKYYFDLVVIIWSLQDK
jgi:hypothetical protein